ncbi:MAG: class I SAM-dependent RNA methyltransferase [Acidobacteriota bacterium]
MSAYRPNPSRVAALDELDVNVEKLIQGGDGMARADGLPILIPRAAPGDQLKVRVVERKPDYARAEILEVVVSGPRRRDPPCRLFDRCGGCDLQHIEDDEQLRLKIAAAHETLERLGNVRGIEPSVHGAGSWGYRSRAQVRIDREADPPAVGFYARGSHDLVPVDHCPVLAPELDELLPQLPRRLAESNNAPARIDLAAARGRVVGAPPVPGIDSGDLEAEILGLRFQYDARCFFQVNQKLLPELVETALGDLRGSRAVDLYAGVGLFTLHLARRYDRVVGVESDRVAVRFARRNLRINGIDNVDYVGLRVESALETLSSSIDRVLVDPPRSGLPKKLRAALLEHKPPELTYVSCQPATLARDLRALCEIYELDDLHYFDLFPQTGHLESVAQLRLRRP